MEKTDKKQIVFQLSPVTIFIVAFFLIPIIILLVYSFWRIDNSQLIKEFTIVNYINVLKNALYMKVLLRSVVIGFLVSMLGIIISYLLAYGVVFKLTKLRDLIIFLIIISLLSNYLVRIYAWRTILGSKGVINTLLIYLGIIKEPISALLFNNVSVFIALLHILIPFIILPIYSALLNIDPTLLEAARDLGANPVRTFFKVTLPLSTPGLKAAFIFSFIIASGDYIIPQMLGGTSGLMIGRVIADQFGLVYNWGEGSALVFILILTDLLLFGLFNLLLTKRSLRRREIEIKG
jgi:spermidine/putrescine transport system permease protein